MRNNFIVSLCLLCGYSCSTNEQKNLTEYFSQDSLFTVSIPNGYSLLNKATFLLSFEHEDNGGIMSIKKEGIIPSAYFLNMVECQMEAAENKGFTIVQVSKSDTSVFYKISKGALYRTEEIIYLKKGVLNDYIIDVSAPDASDIGPQIYHSLKEHNPLGFGENSTMKNGQSIYKLEGFKIDSSYKLVINKDYIQEYALYENRHKLIGAYCCIQNPEDVENMVVVNINIIDYSKEISEDKTGQKVLDDYKATLDIAGYDNSFDSFNGIPALEYSYKQDFGNVNVPVKALFLIHNQKSYLFSLMSLSNIDLEYDKLKKAVHLL